MAKKLNLVDMYGIGLMLEHLVAEGNITCEERDRVILRIARENDIAEYMLSNLAGYGRSKRCWNEQNGGKAWNHRGKSRRKVTFL